MGKIFHNQKKCQTLIIIVILLTCFSNKSLTQIGTNSKAKHKSEITYKSSLYQKLQSIPAALIKPIDPDSMFREAYEIRLTQPLDHQNPGGKKFVQKIILSYIDESSPVVFITEGYSLRHNYVRELSEILNANEIRVEHRYFGDSKPDSMDWQFLNIKQSAEDHHRIVKFFKKIYGGKWISTGWSKGGQTALIHRHFYPDDVDVTVAYNAPLNFALEDPRIDQFFDEVGSEFCRQKLINFQRLILKNKEAILPLFKWYAKGKGYEYSIGLEKAFEYIVLEYPFSFWQYHKIDCGEIPDEGASADEMLEHLRAVVSFSSYSDYAMNSASMYQFSTELGYYGYVTKNVKELLSSSDYPNSAFAPQNTPLIFDPEPMQKLNDWLQNYGNNIIYIYAELDPWSATGVEVTDQTNALKMTLKGGNHFTFINSFPVMEKEMSIDALKSWLDINTQH
jgi:hypothetical protein